MFNRRQFLKSASAGVLLSTGAAVAHGEATADQIPDEIARLKSLKEVAKPITPGERQARVDKARQLMQNSRIDALMVCAGSSLFYFAGVKWWPSERFFAMVIPLHGEAFFLCPKFEEARAREQISLGSGNSAAVLTWEEDESPYALAASAFRDRRIATATIGIEETVPFVFSDGLSKVAPTLKLVSGTPVTAGCRTIKSQHEVELMRLANRVTLTAYAAAHASVRPGMTGQKLEQLINAAHQHTRNVPQV